MNDSAAIPVLQTPRMILLPLQLADAERTQQLFPHWEIVRYLAPQVPWPYPPDGAMTYFRDMALPAIARGDEWHWTLRLKESPEQMIGMISLFRQGEHHRGFWLSAAWQGLGLMTEAVIAVNDYWFDVQGFPVLRSRRAAANLASRRIAEKTGMRLVATGEKEFVGGRMPYEEWEITAEEWRAARERIRAASRRA